MSGLLQTCGKKDRGAKTHNMGLVNQILFLLNCRCLNMVASKQTHKFSEQK